MAELPELQSPVVPQSGPMPPPRQLYDRPHSYGVARELDRIKAGFVPPPRTPRVRPGRSRMRRGPWASFRRWSAARDRGPADLWHRIRCRTGHHQIRGGHQMQLGSRWVFVERRCVWCDASPPL
ncbi:MAG: hypothetical protein M3326_10215 [Actinomycetota bacterium]|nr:hypothetical protein [Actinomycetota bacterium]